jgi:hypothetical protein
MNWLSKWREERKAEERRKGFDYGAGELLRGVSTVILEDTVAFSDKPFDHGVNAAIQAWREAKLARITRLNFIKDQFATLDPNIALVKCIDAAISEEQPEELG